MNTWQVIMNLIVVSAAFCFGRAYGVGALIGAILYTVFF